MRKIVTLLGLSLIILALVGCKKTTETDMYGNPIGEEATEATVTTSDDNEEDTALATTEAEVAADPVTEAGTSDGPEADDQASPEEAETVSEDVYDNEGSAVEAVEAGSVEVVEPTSINDPEFEASLMTYFDPIYYNLFFRLGDYTEGITEEDMIKFAISFIYQNEYNEMKFDTTDFILYVPEKRVEELVLRYFDFVVTGHHSFIEENLQYQDGDYLVPPVDTKQEKTMEIVAVKATGDFSYDVIMPMPEVDEEGKAYYRASIEVRNDRYVLVAYLMQTQEEAQLTDSDLEDEASTEGGGEGDGDQTDSTTTE